MNIKRIHILSNRLKIKFQINVRIFFYVRILDKYLLIKMNQLLHLVRRMKKEKHKIDITESKKQNCVDGGGLC
jgi:hypothetical protein